MNIKNNKIELKKMTEERLAEFLIGVNSTISYFDKGYTSVKRTPMSTCPERMTDFKEFITIRLNYDCFLFPEFREIAELTGGKVFDIISTEGLDEHYRKFKTMTIQVKQGLFTMSDSAGNNLGKIMATLIGGTRIKFNYSLKRIKLSIDGN